MLKSNERESLEELREELYQLQGHVNKRIIELGGQPLKRYRANYSPFERLVRWVLLFMIERPVAKLMDATIGWLDEKLRDRKR